MGQFKRTIVDILNEYRDGKTVGEIAKKYEISPKIIWEIVQEYYDEMFDLAEEMP